MLRIDNFFIATALALIILASGATGQTTVFNIPTADTLARGTVNLEMDFILKPVPYRKGGYQTYGYRLAFGIDQRTEVGSNFYYNWDGHTSTGQAEFSVKRRIYQNEKHRFGVAAGTVVFVPLRNRAGDRTSAMIYGNARKTIGPLGGMTLTGGVYSVFRGSREFGTRTGAIVGVVQPISRRLSFVADWFSGRNRLGYVSAGLNYNITNRQYFLAGYSFGNSGRGNNAMAAYYGLTF
jgi:hypothetical protein